jgi:ribosomal protein S18 acetylase RimI-like enzyme
MKCAQCPKDAVYRCSVCQRLLCPEHIRLRTVCESCAREKKTKCALTKAASRDYKEIKRLVKLFWGEQDQLTFDKLFTVAELPAFVAKIGKKVIGFVSFAEVLDDLIIVALAVLPEYQGMGIGSSLIVKVEGKARTSRKKRILVSTSNDDLPALAFYQSLGFQIYEVKPNVIAEKHGGVMRGIGNLPIRDELRLRKNVH